MHHDPQSEFVCDRSSGFAKIVMQRSDVCMTDKVNQIFLVFPVCSPPCLDATAAYPWSCPRGVVSKQYQRDERIRHSSCRGYIQNCRYRIWHLGVYVCGGAQAMLCLLSSSTVFLVVTCTWYSFYFLFVCFIYSIKSTPIWILFHKIGFLYLISIFRPL